MGARRVLAALGGIVAVVLLPAVALAHPLGNFTINHYAGVRVEPNRILLDIVIDQAEIPAFQERLAFDTDGDGDLSAAETQAAERTACDELVGSLDLRVAGERLPLTLTEAGLSFPPGAGGLSTMRSVCGFEARLPASIAAGTAVSFADGSFAERIGWREIVVEGSGVGVASSRADVPLRATSPSSRLTAYPEDLLARALADTSVELTATRGGGPALPPFDIPDADAVAGSGTAPVDDSTRTDVGGRQDDPTTTDQVAPAAADALVPAAAAAVPGGVGAGDLPAIFRAEDLTPVVLLVSILTAAALGAGHALTPGHGKTLMAAYLVGTRGTRVHAVGLGLSVALSHTLGILVLAAVVVGAEGILPPDVVVRAAPLIAAVSIVAIGGWMLLGEARRRRAGWAATVQVWLRARDHDHGHAHGAAHGHANAHEHHDHHPTEPADVQSLAHSHDHPHDHRHDAGNAHHDHPVLAGEHSHGGVRHSHLPATGTSISWRSLFVLGLAGGLIPSASALLILLGSIAAGRPAFGFILVVAFGLGMALVMGGIGIALVTARGRLDRVDTSTRLGRLGSFLPLVASCLVLAFGVYLTVQAVSGSTTF